MPKKLTKREKALLLHDELSEIDQEQMAKKWCIEVANSLRIDLFEDNGVIYSREGEKRGVFHKPVNAKKLWTETRWILMERSYQELRKKGKVADTGNQY